MSKKISGKVLVEFRELLMANSIQVDAMARLLIEKGLFTETEFFTTLKDVQADYQNKNRQ